MPHVLHPERPRLNGTRSTASEMNEFEQLRERLRDPARQLKLAGCCSFIGWSCVVSLAFSFHQKGDLLNKANAWDVATMWQQTTCQVLASGVSCTDIQKLGGALGYFELCLMGLRGSYFLSRRISFSTCFRGFKGPT